MLDHTHKEETLTFEHVKPTATNSRFNIDFFRTCNALNLLWTLCCRCCRLNRCRSRRVVCRTTREEGLQSKQQPTQECWLAAFHLAGFATLFSIRFQARGLGHFEKTQKAAVEAGRQKPTPMPAVAIGFPPLGCRDAGFLPRRWYARNR